MKKISLSLILSIFAFGFIQAQEIPKTTNSGASVKPATSGSNSVFLPRVNNEVEDIFMKKEERKINMRQDKNGLLTEGDRVAAEWKADKKAKEEYANDQYLGDVKTTGKFVELYCRDHEFVDGDRALNQGLSGPNTAMLKVFGEDGQQLVSKEWNLLTGAKASLMVVKQ